MSLSVIHVQGVAAGGSALISTISRLEKMINISKKSSIDLKQINNIDFLNVRKY